MFTFSRPDCDAIDQFVKDNPVPLSIGPLLKVDDCLYSRDVIEVHTKNYTCGCVLSSKTGRISVIYDYNVNAPESDNVYFEAMLQPYINVEPASPNPIDVLETHVQAQSPSVTNTVTDDH